MFTFFKLQPQWIPTRIIICVMIFSSCWMNYMCRLQMSILAVPMIRTVEDKQTSGACLRTEKSNIFSNAENNADSLTTSNSHIFSGGTTNDRNATGAWKSEEGELRRGIQLFSGQPFEWTPFIRGQLISAYAWGNVPGNFIGGVLSQRFGPRQAVLWSSIIAAVVSLVSPLLAQLSWMALAASRVVIGFTAGITFPAGHTLVAKWAPPHEKNRFIWTLQGGTFGSIFLFAIISGIAEAINWESAWYIPALVMIIWIGLWWLLAYDSPDEHPAISEKEKKYINECQAGIVQKARIPLKDIPFLKVFTSIPFICLVLCHFGNMFLLYFYQNGMMLYQTKALGFQLTKGGVVAGLPWASRVIFAFLFGWAGDAIKRKNIMSVTTLRKGATIFSHFLPGICLIIVGYLGCSLFWANVFLVLALGFNGAASIANLANNQDLSPNLAGFLYGIMNTFATLAGVIISPMVEEIAGKWGHPIEKWRILFWIGAALCILCMLIYVVGGSGNVQRWNELERRDERITNSTTRDEENVEGSSEPVKT